MPDLAATRQVIAVDLQGHGRTNDIDRPLAAPNLASDVVSLLDHLDVDQVDAFGFSLGGFVAVELAVRHPERVRKLIASSVSFSIEGTRQENIDGMGELTTDMLAGTPMEQEFLAKSPNPDKFQDFLDKFSKFDTNFKGWTEEEIAGIAAPTLITVGDCDMIPLSHAVRFLQLRGGDVNGDFVGVPASQLAVLPGTTHFYGMSRPSLILELVLPFLDAPMPGTTADPA